MIYTLTYKVFSTLLLYPNRDIKKNIEYAIFMLKKDNILSEFDINNVNILFKHIENTSLLKLQETYIYTFDRQRKLSLYLFEHIHGDSRERGMAMVDLKNLYRESNFDMSINKELPDYIPVFLEYLSLINRDKAFVLLGNVIDIITLLEKRLKIINSPYYIIFHILQNLSNIKSNKSIINNIILQEKNVNNNVIKLDEEWKEPKIL